ncbi:MAG: type II secretion system protein M [Spirochaetes bacterium]|nr:type II secretion system protein M [Spirochaetota bacterium]
MIQLSKREKIMLKVLLGILGALALYYLIISPLIGMMSSMNSSYEENITRMQRLQHIHEQYQEIRLKRSQYESQINSTVGITTLIEETAKNLKILGNKSYVRVIPGSTKDNYKKISAEVKFVGVDMQSVLKFIHGMEHSNNLVRTSYMRISEALKGRDIYDVEIKFDSLTSQ